MNNASTVHSPSPRTRIAAPSAGIDARVDGLLGLYRTHFTNLVRLTLLLVEDRDAAVDVVNQAFALQMRTPGAGELPGIGTLRSSVVALARRRAPAAGREVRTLLDALYALPHAQREALVLQRYGALSDDDIAAASGAPIEVVTATAADGLRALDVLTTTREDA